MRVLRMDPMLLLAVVVGLGVLLTMKLATINTSIVSNEDQAQKLKYDIYASSAAYYEKKDTVSGAYPEDKRFSKLSISSR